MLDPSRHALHGCGYGEEIARSYRAIGIAVAFEAVALERWRKRRIRGRDRQTLESRRRGHDQPLLIDPRACREILRRVADHDIVTADRFSHGDVDHGHLMALRHALPKWQTARQPRSHG